MFIISDGAFDMCVADHRECADRTFFRATEPCAGWTNPANTRICDRLTCLRKERAALSAKAAQARGRGEWALAAQIATQMANLDGGPVSAKRR
jgi:hypothetical protein